MRRKNKRIVLTDSNDLIYMSYHAREEAKEWTKLSHLALSNNIIIQSAVLSSYSIELYLKSLLMILGIDALKEFKGSKGHQLRMLFDRLPDENLKYSIAINATLNPNRNSKKTIDYEKILNNFEDKLNKISDSYNQYRYLYQKYFKKMTITIPLEFIFRLNTVLEKECDLINYEQCDKNGDVTNISDPKISYHIIDKGWVDDDSINKNDM